MKSIFLLLFSFTLTLAALSQDSWKVSFNNKTLVKTSEENAEKNVIAIKASDLNKQNNLLVTYIPTETKSGWERTISLYTEKDSLLSQQKGNQFKIKNSTLQSLFKKGKTIKIYTWALPTDPKLKASVRVRRVHLCTLQLQ